MTIEDQLLRDEGCRLHPYTDTRGKLTIGIGRCLDTKGISAQEARVLFANDLRDVRADLAGALSWLGEVDDARRGVVENMAFNLGLGGLLGFRRMLEALRQRDYNRAAREMRDSEWFIQVGARAERLALQMEDGSWR